MRTDPMQPKTQRGNGDLPYGDPARTTTWDFSPVRASHGSGRGDDGSKDKDWVFRSIFTILFGILLFFFQSMYRKVDNFADRIPVLEANQVLLGKQLDSQGRDLARLRELQEILVEQGRTQPNGRRPHR